MDDGGWFPLTDGWQLHAQDACLLFWSPESWYAIGTAADDEELREELPRATHYKILARPPDAAV